MAWFNNGDWENLSLPELMECVRQLMWAVNEREHAIGKRVDDTTGHAPARYLEGLSAPYFNDVYGGENENLYGISWMDGELEIKKNRNGYTKWFCYSEDSPETLVSGDKEFEGLVEKAFPEISDFAGVNYALFFQENLKRLCNSITGVYKKTGQQTWQHTWMHMLLIAHKMEQEDGSVIYSILTDKDETIWDEFLSRKAEWSGFKDTWPDRRVLLDKPSGTTNPYDVKWNWCDYQAMLEWPWVGEIKTTDPRPFIEIRNVLEKMVYIQTIVEFPEMDNRGMGKVAALPLVEASGGGVEYPAGEDCADDYTALKATFNSLPLVPVYKNMTQAPEGEISGTITGDQTIIQVQETGVSGKDTFPEETPFYVQLGPIVRDDKMEFSILSKNKEEGYWYAGCGPEHAGKKFFVGDELVFFKGSYMESKGTLTQSLIIPEMEEGYSGISFHISFELNSGYEFPDEDSIYMAVTLSAVFTGSSDNEIIKVLEITSGGDWEVQRTAGNEYEGVTKVRYLNPVPYNQKNISYVTPCYVNQIEVGMDGGYPENLFVGGYQDKVRMVITRFYSGENQFNVVDIEKIGGQLKYIKADYHGRCVRPHTATLSLNATGDWASMMNGALPTTKYIETSETISETIPYIGAINDDSVMNCSLDLNEYVLDMPVNAEMKTRTVQPYVNLFKEDFGEDDAKYLKNSQAETTGDWEAKGMGGTLTRDTSGDKIEGTASWKFQAYTPFFQAVFGQTNDSDGVLLEAGKWYRIRVTHKGDAFKMVFPNISPASDEIMNCPASASVVTTEKVIYVPDDWPAVGRYGVNFRVYIGMSTKTIWVDGVQFFHVHGNNFVKQHSDDVSGVSAASLVGGITLPFPEPDVDAINYDDPSEEVYAIQGGYNGALLSIPHYSAFERGNLSPILREGGGVSVQGNFQLPDSATVASMSGKFLIKPIYSGDDYDKKNYGAITTGHTDWQLANSPFLGWSNYNGVYYGGLTGLSGKESYFIGDIFSKMEWIYYRFVSGYSGEGLDWSLNLGNKASRIKWTQNKAGITFWYKPELDTGEEETQSAYVAFYHGSLVMGRQLKLLYDISGILTYG